MKRFSNIAIASIVLTLILFGTSGLSLEKCSCTGQVSVVMAVDKDCCQGESSCMVVKTMHFSDYMPTAITHLDLPFQPLLFTLFSSDTAVFLPIMMQRREFHGVHASPGGLATTVAVLRV